MSLNADGRLSWRSTERDKRRVRHRSRWGTLFALWCTTVPLHWFLPRQERKLARGTAGRPAEKMMKKEFKKKRKETFLVLGKRIFIRCRCVRLLAYKWKSSQPSPTGPKKKKNKRQDSSVIPGVISAIPTAFLRQISGREEIEFQSPKATGA